MVTAKLLDPSVILVTSENPTKKGLVIHGYGGNKEEMLGLAVMLAGNAGLALLIFDLPGHGAFQDKEFNLENSLKRIKEIIHLCHSEREYASEESQSEILRHNVPQDDIIFIGHSIGARLGLMSGISKGILLSMPGDAFFEGNKKDLMRILRVRRVKEKLPFSGLEEILSVEVKPSKDNLMLAADKDIQSVTALYDECLGNGIECKKIKNSNHLDIVSSSHLCGHMLDWIKDLS